MTAGIAKAAFICMVCLVVQGLPAHVLADYYSYKDSTGTVHMTNKLDSVPKKYRSGMKVSSDESLAKKDLGARKPSPGEPAGQPPTASTAQEQRAEPAAAPPAQPEGRFGELSARFPWFKPLAVVAGLFTAFLLVVKISSLISSPQLVRVIYLSFFLAVFVYGYKAYADHVVGSYFSVKQKVLSMFTKANQREGLPDRSVAGIDKP